MHFSDFEAITLVQKAEYVNDCRPLEKRVKQPNNVQPLRPMDLLTEFIDPSDQGIFVGDTNLRDEFRRGVEYTHVLP